MNSIHTQPLLLKCIWIVDPWRELSEQRKIVGKLMNKLSFPTSSFQLHTFLSLHKSLYESLIYKHSLNVPVAMLNSNSKNLFCF